MYSITQIMPTRYAPSGLALSIAYEALFIEHEKGEEQGHAYAAMAQNAA
jgi:hypothetical protein